MDKISPPNINEVPGKGWEQGINKNNINRPTQTGHNTNIPSPTSDCKVKGAILNAVLDGANTCADIRSKVPHVNYGSLRTSLYRYCKYGYLRKVDGKPYRYMLTPKGMEHAANPFLYRENFYAKIEGFIDNKVEEEITNLLQDPWIIERIASEYPSQAETIYKTLTRQIPVPTRDKILEDEGVDIEKNVVHTEKSKREKELVEENLKLRRIIASQRVPFVEVKSPKPPESPKTLQTNENRYNVMKDYLKKQLRKKFFDFSEVPFYPYKVIGSSSMSELAKNKLKGGEVAIYDDRTAAEMVQKGLIRKLTAKEIEECGFFLRQRPEGFYIFSKVFPLKKLIFKSEQIPKKPKKEVRIVPPSK
ncbi:hypothetical protein [Methanococcoides methylutens]|uniref:Uncharacterized protein n=1 Tax=Methanococcoides methylutens MM1 TaxID=1434104 RepID=A0A0E3WZX3_METMT|nr:hypothetical protein [Methanococcoides methylutens]AKB85414.1 hypothetical protein MCMEM_1361 [Methanococcoides methylutens MM1]